jgi:hypothetical protein
MGAWATIAGALGLTLQVTAAKGKGELIKLPTRVSLRHYPQLKRLAWQLGAVKELKPEDALQIYERNWRHVDQAALTDKERELIRALSVRVGGGRLLV